LSDWALHEKLEPKAPIMRVNEIKNLYAKVHKIYVDEMFKMLSHRYKTKIEKPEKLILLWKFYPINLVKRIGYLFIKRTKNYERQILLDCAQLYLLLSFNNINSAKYLKRANNFLYQLNTTIKKDLSWDKARLLASNMRLM